ncbi:multicopper oxidase [Rhexocercosporidium sp. MPI-PUGE-AT-0058]|nr:multicopper oxidase [Rhexocercosporidium sp. MPI-PUGE-AT-0058]
MLLGALFSSVLVFGLGSASVIPDATVQERGQFTEPGSGHGWHKGVGWGHNRNKNYHGGKNGGWGQRNCENGPDSRSCWTGDFTVETDSEERWPHTGKTVHYDLDISNMTLSLDGTPRSMLVINKQYPGPVITADWGDMLEIDVTNSMQDNGTSIHWHGFTQVGSGTEDGVNGVTECPIPPGSTRRYSFRATQYGTTWYHSHFSHQYGDGIVGTMQINGPASADYDIDDLGPIAITDFYYESMWKLGRVADGTTPIPGKFGPPSASNGLINGANMNVAKTAGHYFNTTLIPGKRYRLRLVNTAVDNAFMVSLDSHQFTVIQADFVPIVPYETDWLFIAIGQRYDVVFTASEDPANYWFRAEVQKGCGTNDNNGQILGIFNYKTVPLALPTSKPVANYTAGCVDEVDLEPILKKSVPKHEFRKVYGYNGTSTLTVGLKQNEKKIFFWTINGNAINVNWDKPTLQYVGDGDNSFLANKELGIIEIPHRNIYTFWVIQNGGAVAHPIHLHGHDMFVLGISDPSDIAPAPANGTAKPTYFTADNIDDLNFDNPTRRDVAMLPANGWLVIAFQTDNPGAWLMHCHIAWHVSEGLAVQFLERQNDIPKSMDLGKVKENCKAWDKWYHGRPPTKTDSGL